MSGDWQLVKWKIYQMSLFVALMTGWHLLKQNAQSTSVLASDVTSSARFGVFCCDWTLKLKVDIHTPIIAYQAKSTDKSWHSFNLRNHITVEAGRCPKSTAMIMNDNVMSCSLDVTEFKPMFILQLTPTKYMHTYPYNTVSFANDQCIVDVVFNCSCGDDRV